MKKVICILLAVACIAFLILSPAFIASGLGKSIYEVKEERRQTRYEGHIELWHVVSFKTPSSSGYSFVTGRMRALERQLPYVYIDVHGMTAEEASERLAKGERPDVISYPMGFIGEEGLLKLELKGFAQPFKQRSPCAYPYMADSYVLVANTDMLFEAGLSAPIGELMEEDTLLYACEVMGKPIAFTDVAGLDGDMVLDSLVLEEGGQLIGSEPMIELEDISFSKGGMEAFKSGETAMIICPYSEYVKLTEAKDAPNYGMQYYDISRRTDLIQMVSAYDSGDEEKNAVLRRICTCLISLTSQKKITDLGMFPVLDWKAEDTGRMNSYQLLFSEDE